jgi:hypothetical protein
LKLSSPVDLSSNPHITTACLPDNKFADFTNQRCWTTGWGKDNWEYGKYQNILKEVDVPVIEQNKCQHQLRQTRLGHSYNLNPGFLCAGGEEGKDACKGVSFSNLFLKMYFIIIFLGWRRSISL